MLLVFVLLVATSIIMMGTSTALYNSGEGDASVGPFTVACLLAVAAYFVFGVL